MVPGTWYQVPYHASQWCNRCIVKRVLECSYVEFLHQNLLRTGGTFVQNYSHWRVVSVIISFSQISHFIHWPQSCSSSPNNACLLFGKQSFLDLRKRPNQSYDLFVIAATTSIDPPSSSERLRPTEHSHYPHTPWLLKRWTSQQKETQRRCRCSYEVSHVLFEGVKDTA